MSHGIRVIHVRTHENVVTSVTLCLTVFNVHSKQQTTTHRQIVHVHVHVDIKFLK